MKILVMSRQKAKSASYHRAWPTTAIISIVDVEAKPVYFSPEATWIKSILKLRFDDVEKGEDNCLSREQAGRIADFFLKTRDQVEQIIVHCEAGVSRSAGVAAALLKYAGEDQNQILKNPKYRPNMTCYRMVLNCLHESGGGLGSEDE